MGIAPNQRPSISLPSWPRTLSKVFTADVTPTHNLLWGFPLAATRGLWGNASKIILSLRVGFPISQSEPSGGPTGRRPSPNLSLTATAYRGLKRVDASSCLRVHCQRVPTQFLLMSRGSTHLRNSVLFCLRGCGTPRTGNSMPVASPLQVSKPSR